MTPYSYYSYYYCCNILCIHILDGYSVEMKLENNFDRWNEKTQIILLYVYIKYMKRPFRFCRYCRFGKPIQN